MKNEISEYLNARVYEFSQIDNQRRKSLLELAEYISNKSEKKPADLIFICTHNSRRSHMSQIWAQVAAYSYGIGQVKTFSGGTEATAFNPRAVRALQKTGIIIEKQDDSQNPRYEVSYSEDVSPVTAFSKKYSDTVNPQKDFCAIMTCSDADEACPVVFGAEARISLPYEDPKNYDNTDLEEAKYDERCRQIAREMLFVFSNVKKQ